MTILSVSAYPVLAGAVAKNRDADINARFVTLKASEAVNRPAKCVEIPTLNVDAMKVAINANGKVLAMAVGLFEDYQSKMIQLDMAKGKETIYASNISLDAMILNFESDVSSGGRISKDKIIASFLLSGSVGELPMPSLLANATVRLSANALSNHAMILSLLILPPELTSDSKFKIIASRLILLA